MVDFTTVNPTDDAFRTGTNIHHACSIGIKFGLLNTTVGTGKLVTFTPSTVVAQGTYNALSSSGDVHITVTPQGSRFMVTIAITGSFQPESRTFLAEGQQVNNDTVRLVGVDNPSLVLELAQSDGGAFSDGKIHVRPSWAAAKFYLTAET